MGPVIIYGGGGSRVKSGGALKKFPPKNSAASLPIHVPFKSVDLFLSEKDPNLSLCRNRKGALADHHNIECR